MYDKIGEAGIGLLKKNLPLIALDIAPRIVQANLSDRDIYPQRSPHDGLINWAKTSKQIYDFVRAQTKPYPGAFTYYQQYKVIIWACEIVSSKNVQEKKGVILSVAEKDDKSQLIISTGDLEWAIMINEYLVLSENDQEVEDTKDLFRIGGCFFTNNQLYGE